MSRDGPVRVLSLTLAEDAHANAQQVNARDIAARLDPSRFEVTLLSDGSGPAAVAALPHVRLVPLPARRQSLRILRRLFAGGYDVILYPGPGLPESLFVRLPRWFMGRRARVLMPVEGDVRQLDETPAWIRRRIDRLHLRADALFPITEFVARGLEARCGRTGEVVPVGVDVHAFRPREGERAPGPLRVLSVGTVKAWKRPEVARAAAAALPDVSFAWVGDGDLRASEAARAPSNLAFEGPCARSAIAARYREADVYFHPSRMEGMPKAVLEAMASGLPVVVADEWEPRFVTDSGAGLSARGETALVVALSGIVSDPALRTRTGLAARAAAERFSWDLVAKRWAAILEREADLARR